MRLMNEKAGGSTSSNQDDSSSNVHMNYPLLSALLAFAIAQAIKVFTTWYVFTFISHFLLFFLIIPANNTSKLYMLLRKIYDCFDIDMFKANRDLVILFVNYWLLVQMKCNVNCYVLRML